MLSPEPREAKNDKFAGGVLLDVPGCNLRDQDDNGLGQHGANLVP